MGMRVAMTPATWPSRKTTLQVAELGIHTVLPPKGGAAPWAA